MGEREQPPHTRRRWKRGQGGIRQKRGVWHIRYCVGRRRIEERTDAANRSEAQKILNERLGELSKGVTPAAASRVRIAELYADVQEDYRNRGVRFLGVDHRDDRAAALAFVDEFGITYPSVSDPAGALADDYELVGLPSTFVIHRRGSIVYRFTGYLDGAVLRSALDDVLRGAGG